MHSKRDTVWDAAKEGLPGTLAAGAGADSSKLPPWPKHKLTQANNKTLGASTRACIFIKFALSPRVVATVLQEQVSESNVEASLNSRCQHDESWVLAVASLIALLLLFMWVRPVDNCLEF